MSIIRETKNALQVAKKAHQGQLRAIGSDTGLEYFDTHIVRVTEAVGWQEKPASALHDVVEDTSMSLSDLIETGFFSGPTMFAVDILTHRVGETYEGYIERIAWPSNSWSWDWTDPSVLEFLVGLTTDETDNFEELQLIGYQGLQIARLVKIEDIMDNLRTLPHGESRNGQMGLRTIPRGEKRNDTEK
jgi:(p)ppGpp synthase/HD superfamily hydrolase